MAGLLIRAIDNVLPDPDQDRIGCVKKGMPVMVMTDAQVDLWKTGKVGAASLPPYFWVVHAPGVEDALLQKYVEPQYQALPMEEPPIYRKRKWIVRWNDLPQGAKDKLEAEGLLTIKVGSYTGPFDYTWTQVKAYFRNQDTGLDETAEL